jgi:hypothetical protein
MTRSPMRAVTRVRSLGAAALAALMMVIATPAAADLCVRDPDVFLHDRAQATLNGESSFVTRRAGTAEPAIPQPGRPTLSRTQ